MDLHDHPGGESGATQEPIGRASPPSETAQSLNENTSLDARVRAFAHSIGFDVVGVARADEALSIEHQRYLDFIEQGMHGSMHYLARYAEVRERLDTSAILEGAKSIICVGKRYARPADAEKNDSPLVGTIARYAKGHDYHGHVRALLKRLAAFVCTLAPNTRARPICDIEPVLERAWALRAGLGFVGKNGLVITPGQGSYQILGEVVTTLQLAWGTPMQERCGACTRCLDACPTQAFQAPFVLDPRRCVAYLTIENPGPPDPALALEMGDHLFGCDACQDVCPYNRTAPPDESNTLHFQPLPWLQKLSLEDLCAMDADTWDGLFRGTPLRRAKFAGIVRNAALAAANILKHEPQSARGPEARTALKRAAEHPLPEIRELALGLLAELGLLPHTAPEPTTP